MLRAPRRARVSLVVPRGQPLARALALAPLLAGAGCLFGPLDGIPCTSDETCPTSAFCDLVARECRDLGVTGPPDLQITGLGPPGGPYKVTGTLPRGPGALEVEVKNVGRGTAHAPTFSTNGTACLRLHDDFAFAGIDELLPDEAATFELRVDPEPSCDSPIIVDWFLTFDGRGTRGTVNINLVTPPG